MADIFNFTNGRIRVASRDKCVPFQKRGAHLKVKDCQITLTRPELVALIDSLQEALPADERMYRIRLTSDDGQTSPSAAYPETYTAEQAQQIVADPWFDCGYHKVRVDA